ncbi:PREDICTED: uncharacterized protein LOC109359901 [Lupinus angustifolius]|uniref:uncharacterized protein LOC109359901 n=1 Tax=Lupinus angustifolius TaxID=3871 RepID=UPI00092F4A14|nr:PREDICTED: uncharacterized protein LOC109359901 [Lupinus angustifolius]
MVSLGKGFYEFSFSSLEDMRSVCATGSWNLRSGFLRLFLWTPDFNPSIQKLSHCQCWVKITGLPQEYWSPRIIFSIAGGIGTPISLDEATNNRTFGHFARVLVDVSLKGNIPDQILVEREGYAFFVGIEYENLPDFCSGCQSIGHLLSNCRRKKDSEVPKKPEKKQHSQKESSQVKEIPLRVNDLVINLNMDVNDPHSNPDRVMPQLDIDSSEEELEVTQVRDTLESLEIDKPTPETEMVMDNNETENEFSVLPLEDMENLNAVNDMRIVGKLWANEVEEAEEEVEVSSLRWGIGNPNTRLVLKNLVLANKPDLLFIAEPKVDFNEIHPSYWSQMNLKLFIVNKRQDLLPSLWGLCNKNVDPIVFGCTDQLISVSMTLNNINFNFAAVYANTNYLVRRKLWDDLHILLSSFAGPWCFVGDFNAIMGTHEHRGSKTPSRIPIIDFKEFSDRETLIHLSTRGSDFTWSNKRRGDALTEKRLDRAICNEGWLNAWNQVSCCTLPRISSDHNPILLNCSSYSIERVTSFRFQSMWMQHSNCRSIIEASWNGVVFGCPMYVLSSKLRRLKSVLKVWNREVFGNIHQRVKEAMMEVETIQTCINDLQHNHEDMQMLLDEEVIAQRNLLKVLGMEEEFLREKSRINWQTQGDRNTAFFHRITKIR